MMPDKEKDFQIKFLQRDKFDMPHKFHEIIFMKEYLNSFFSCVEHH